MRKNIIQRNLHSLVEADVGPHLGNDALELAVVKHHGDRLVPDEAALQVIAQGIPHGGQVFGGHVIRVELHPQGVGNGGVDLVPGEDFIPGDLEGFADGVAVAHEAGEAHGEIRVEGQRPEGGSVPVDDDGLALHHAADHLPGALLSVGAHGNVPLVIGVAGADDGDREAFLPVFFHQEFLAGDLVAGIEPVGIAQGRALGDDVAGRRFVIGGGGADIDILAGFAPEEAVIPLHILHGEADEFADGVEGQALQLLGGALFIMDVRRNLVDPFGNHLLPGSPVQKINLPQGIRRQAFHDGGADGAGASDKKSFFHCRAPLHRDIKTRPAYYSFLKRTWLIINIPVRRRQALFSSAGSVTAEQQRQNQKENGFLHMHSIFLPLRKIRGNQSLNPVMTAWAISRPRSSFTFT